MIEFSEVATVIELAVAPAFLLTGIGAIWLLWPQDSQELWIDTEF